MDSSKPSQRQPDTGSFAQQQEQFSREQKTSKFYDHFIFFASCFFVISATTSTRTRQDFLNQQRLEQNFRNQQNIRVRDEEVPLSDRAQPSYYDYETSEDQNLLERQIHSRQYRQSAGPEEHPAQTQPYEVSEDRKLLERTVRKQRFDKPQTPQFPTDQRVREETTTERQVYQESRPEEPQRPQYDDYELTEDRNLMEQGVRKRRIERPEQGPEYYDYEISEDRSLLEQDVRKRRYGTEKPEDRLPTLINQSAAADSAEAILSQIQKLVPTSPVQVKDVS